MLTLYKTITLSNKEQVTLKCWGELPRSKYAIALFNFASAFGKAAELGLADEEFGIAFEKLEALIKLSVIEDSMMPNMDEITFDDKMMIASELWTLNGLDGGGIKKMLSLCLSLMEKTTEAIIKEKSKETLTLPSVWEQSISDPS